MFIDGDRGRRSTDRRASVRSGACVAIDARHVSRDRRRLRARAGVYYAIYFTLSPRLAVRVPNPAVLPAAHGAAVRGCRAGLADRAVPFVISARDRRASRARRRRARSTHSAWDAARSLLVRALVVPGRVGARRRLGRDRAASPITLLAHAADHDDAPGLPARGATRCSASACSRRARPGSPSSARVARVPRRAARRAGASSTTASSSSSAACSLMIVDRSCRGTSAMYLKDGRPLHRRVPVHAHPQPRRGRRRQLARHVRVLHVADRPRHVAVGRAAAGRARRGAAARAHRHARGPRALHGRAVGDRRGRGVLRSSRPSSTTTSSRRSRRSALLVAFFLDDILARRDRLHPLYAALGIGIVLLVARDLMCEPERWIEMFVFRYDRPWPTAEPWPIDPSRRLPRARHRSARRARARRHCAGAGSASSRSAPPASRSASWSLQVYMPIAGTHWGMREAVRTYYEQRTIYGQKLVYFGARQLHDDWRDVGTNVDVRDVHPRHAAGRPADDDHAPGQQGRRRAHRSSRSSR